ncbi:hypothetical protein OMP38_05035 [Cohnella ginsengisoli]|uniref:Uncharacterized protein n=1 Tax=Cohnella ginsengisoli TaxID=425004 RepID=A0A9X4KET8_9BACL|nr:hypothetical protein [Cohnella ginsengisoli]
MLPNHPPRTDFSFPTQRTKADFIDDAADISKLYAHSPKIGIAKYQPENFDGDDDRFQHTNDTPVSAEY